MPFEQGAGGIIDLEEQGVVVDEREEETIGVDADAAEHAFGGDPAGMGELFENVFPVGLADGHGGV